MTTCSVKQKSKENKRHTLVHSRFEVGCSLCGVIGYCQTRKEAEEYAEHARKLHHSPDEIVTVGDLMAHKPKPGCRYASKVCDRNYDCFSCQTYHNEMLMRESFNQNWGRVDG